MKPPSDAQLNRLLAGRNQLTRADKDAVLEGVLARLPSEEKAAAASRPSGLAWPWLRWAGVAAVALLLAAPLGAYLALSAGRGGGEGGGGLLTARGGQKVRPAFSVVCAEDMVEGRCRSGGKLLFKIDRQGAARFAALARHEQTRAVVWYFEEVDLGALPAGGLLDQGIPLGPEHAAGRWEVVGVFSGHALTKAEIRAILQSEDPSKEGPAGGVEVVRRALEVAP